MRSAALALTIALAIAAPAEACLTCGCSGSGISGDVAGGGSAFLFSNCATMIIQQGVSVRAITGSFTETGSWNPTPTDGALNTLQGSFGVMWFPTPNASLSLTLLVLLLAYQDDTLVGMRWTSNCSRLSSTTPTESGAG